MNHYRRDALKIAAAIVLLPALPSMASGNTNTHHLKLVPSDHRLFDADQGPARLWTYNGMNPGPEIRCRKGERLTVKVENLLPQSTSVHWHGIRIVNAMDGVSGLTQTPIPPESSFTYDFVVPDAGTYWYHPHNRTWEQMARGLYGPLIIEEDEPYSVDAEQVLVIDDWRLNDDGSLHEESFGSGRDWSHAGRLGNWATVNGTSQPDFEFQQDGRVRLRLVNSSNARVFPLVFGDLPAAVVALDGQPLEQPEQLNEQSPLVLAPAQRADVVVDVTGSGALVVPGQEGGRTIATFTPKGKAASGLFKTPVAPLPSNDIPLPSLAEATSVKLVMEGGAMRWLQTGLYKGEQLDGRTLAEQGQFWSFNGQVGRTETPLFTCRAHQTVVVDMENRTRWPHAMHFHGHHFREVDRSNPDGLPGPWRDTILLNPEESKKVAFVADNPGKWMIHCHMLEHQVSGMATWFHVT